MGLKCLGRHLFIGGLFVLLVACAAQKPEGQGGAVSQKAQGDASKRPIAVSKKNAQVKAENSISWDLNAYMDRQQQELETRLGDEVSLGHVEISRLEPAVIKLTMNSEVSFAVNSSVVKELFRPTLDKVSEIIRRFSRTRVAVVGHTDDLGTEQYNLWLSNRRAISISNYLVAHGVRAYRIGTDGRGELAPRADNQTEEGRLLNRRVEIYLSAGR